MSINELSLIRVANIKAIVDSLPDSLAGIARNWDIGSQSLRNILSGKSNVSEKMTYRITLAMQLEKGWLNVDRRENPEVPPPPRPQQVQMIVNEAPVNVRIWSDNGDIDIAIKSPKNKAVAFVLALMDAN